MAKYVVTAEYVTLRTRTPDGVRQVGMYKGAPVPDDVPADQIDHHLRRSLIRAVDDEPEPPADTVEQVNDIAPTPARSASKGDWVAYATGHGVTETDAKAATRDQLADRFLGPSE